LPYQEAEVNGVRGYYDAVRDGKLAGGAHDFAHIHTFFRESGLTMVGLEPNDARVGGDPQRFKCARDEMTTLVYLANPGGNRPETDDVSGDTPALALHLPEGTYHARWYDPRNAAWHPGPTLPGGQQTLTAPGPGDWLLLLQEATRS
jgi:hypothetical protein